MERLSFSPGDCGWGDRLLKSMYYVTHLHGSHYSYEIEKMWSTVAGNPKNVRPILDFLVSFGVKECAVQVRRISLLPRKESCTKYEHCHNKPGCILGVKSKML